MSKEERRVPELRFKGFHDDWEQRMFQELVNRVSHSSENEHLPRVEYEDIISGRGELNKNLSLKESEKKGTEFLPNDILFGKLRPYLNKWLYPNFHGIAVGDFWVLRSREIESKFIYYMIQTNKFKLISNISSGSKMPRSDWNIVSNSKFTVPLNLLEGQKISATLSSIDNLITLHQRKINILETLKKVYLNVMFPNRSEDIPRLHFKFFNEAWEQRKVEDIAIVNTGKKDTQDAVTDGAYDFYVRSPKIEKINSYSYNGEAVLTVGDGVGVGKVFHYVNGKFDYHQRVYKISDFKNYNGLFFYYYFSNNFKYEARKYNAKTSVDSVRREMITKMNFPDTSLNEQVQVGQFFKEIDNIITLHHRKLHRLNRIKQVYLNKMFI
ncbi:restriction endonuclease subunit S [Jeotgalicoccus coquinae]|uniref:EcoKI restriction-modification system protein HsdS n=1 Tax=Jeotgalicoccus coquinae TaxID=709509 RepID=A0A6V7RLU3_9STAP|nr:restriction endonuclease subunit S [Jeotgalicoccus coquinae]MBB6422202.1 type I restriction enzyme S subunit [Jeotgalicoccus coquinae]GGE17818.1 restriction endonuclease subunit S [Jeotgalicoccus coquinae]CAD2079306.1 EcoKI restriction-modification system protein HsdS [Jeotgalicoccus coquinae]